ncbi:hypothetical protein M9H77_09052 [Catharanthus roseus]|uniref:Uncharacterized protein n=1 Tax=Catharanthus roseus TaxID=4058 RepID=A0ACC0BZT4_CATRO|nr:hypothetical protein M9H77_09052 [Catharanthus roseus]
MCPVPRECAAQMNVSCYIESPAGHRGPSGAQMTISNVTHPPPTSKLGDTSEIQLRSDLLDLVKRTLSLLHTSKVEVEALSQARRGSRAVYEAGASPDRLKYNNRDLF